MQFSYKRLNDIFTFLISKKNCVPQLALSEKLGVTARTIRSDIKQINLELKNTGVKIKNKRGEGLYVSGATHDMIEKLFQDDAVSDFSTYNERIQKLTEKLVTTDGVYLNDEISAFYISDATFFSYINTIRNNLEKFNLKIVKSGDFYSVVGNEMAKRSFIANHIIDRTTHGYSWIYNKIN